MIWSASPFADELDVLEIRLATIGPHVDRFVFAESRVGHRGQEKRLILTEALEAGLFAAYRDKISVVVVDDMPEGDGWLYDWLRERHQRNALMRGLVGLAPDDLVLVSDVDEIPYPAALVEAILDPPMRLSMHMHVYRLNWRWSDPPGPDVYIHTTASVHKGAEFLAAAEPDADIYLGERYGPVNYVCLTPPYRLRPDSGWHITYQGGVKAIRDHMLRNPDWFYEAYVPAEVKETKPRDDFLTDEWIVGSMLTGRDLFGRCIRTAWVGLDQLPPYVGENVDRFAHLLIDDPAGRLP